MMMAQDFMEVKILWKSTNMTKRTVFGMNFKVLLFAVSETTGGRTTVYRYMGTATFALHQTTPQGALRQFADKRQT